MPLKDPKKRREYHAQYMKEVWYPKNKDRHITYVRRNKEKVTRFLNEYKKTQKCADCGFSGKKFPYVLDFDHATGSSKRFNVSNWYRAVLSVEAVKLEIAKCEIVCANCHRIRTFSIKRKRRG